MIDKGYGQGSMVMRSNSFEECISKIRKIYGENYTIVRRQECLSDNFFPFMRKKQYEITYTVPQSNYRRSAPIVQSTPQMDFEEERAKILVANQSTSNPQMKLILDEIKELHSKLDEQKVTQLHDDHPTISKIEDLLHKNEFTVEFIQKITERIRKDFSLEELDNFDFVQRSVVDWIGESISVVDTTLIARPEIIILVGPTGVGKTTTVAKLAADFKGLTNPNNPQDLSIRLVSIDNIRIGAKEQLARYASVMNIPFSAPDSVESLHNLLTLYTKEVDVVLIDTSGHSPKDYENLARMRLTLDVKTRKPQFLLTVSASTKANDLRTILQQYEIFGYSSIIVTKLDETESIGTIVSILNEKKKSVAYITNGQNVPRNFKKADVVSFLINLTGFTVDREHIDNKFLAEERKG